jgi:hypothetical protein
MGLATLKKEVIRMKEEIEEKDIYTFEGVESYFENDELSGNEEGFMCGYLSA